MHISVLYDEILSLLSPVAGGLYIDGTLGYGGHTTGIVHHLDETGRVLAFDRDQDALKAAQGRLAAASQHVTFIHDSFASMGTIAPQNGFNQVDGIVLDLGLSSMQLDSRSRGFSFRYDAPLDMRFDTSSGDTAATLINNLTEEKLREIFWRYGEENLGRRFARVIVENRPIHTTIELADLIAANAPKRGRTHPATKVFQALRIAVNDELGALEKGLPAAIQLLKPGGRVAVISFHSLEDRYVKHLFRDLSRECICPSELPICTCDHHATVVLPQRKAIKPSAAEVAQNPRSRSARLRIAEKL